MSTLKINGSECLIKSKHGRGVKGEKIVKEKA